MRAPILNTRILTPEKRVDERNRKEVFFLSSNGYFQISDDIATRVSCYLKSNKNQQIRITYKYKCKNPKN